MSRIPSTRTNYFFALKTCILSLALAAGLAHAQEPKVVSLTPASGADEVDPDLAELMVTFDTDMKAGAHSVCGGGPLFPKLRGQPAWKDARTLVIPVKLEPEHEYEMSLNCAAFQSFKSAAGQTLAPVPWRFTTASKRSPGEQEKLNQRSLDELMKALRDSYSYYDRTGTDWPALAKRFRKRIIAAKSTRAWVKRVAEMLSVAQDPHLWMMFGGRGTGTSQRKYPANFNIKGVEKTIGKLTKRNENAYTADLDGGIFYLLIPSWSAHVKEQILAVDEILKERRKAKGVIFDVRPNTGGDEALARGVAAWFLKGTHTYSENATRDASAPGGFGPVYPRRVKGNRRARRYRGPVVLLVGQANVSSCESFIMMMKQSKNVTVVGEQTGGSSGNPKGRLLENGVEVFIPSWKDILPDGTLLEGKGIGPDVVVEAEAKDFEGGDPVLERGMRLLKEKSR